MSPPRRVSRPPPPPLRRWWLDSCPPPKPHHLLLEPLIADGEHVVAPWDVEGTSPRHQCCELLRRAGYGIFASDRNEHRRLNAPHQLGGHALTRAADASRKRSEIRMGL